MEGRQWAVGGGEKIQNPPQTKNCAVFCEKWGEKEKKQKKNGNEKTETVTETKRRIEQSKQRSSPDKRDRPTTSTQLPAMERSGTDGLCTDIHA